MAARAKFACPQCRRRYRWKPRLASKRVRCKCKSSFEAPAQAPGPAAVTASAGDPNSHQSARFADAEKASATTGSNCPNCGAAAGAEAVICVHCGHNLITGAQVQSTVVTGGGVVRRSGVAAHLIHFGFWIAVMIVLMPPVSYLHTLADAHQLIPVTRDQYRQQDRAEQRLETYSLTDLAMRGVYFAVPLGLLMGLLRYRRAGAVDPWGWLRHRESGRLGTAEAVVDQRSLGRWRRL